MDEQKPKKKKLKPEHKRFVAQVAQGVVPTHAYREIYPNAKMVTARTGSCNLMKKPEIQEGIKEYMERAWPELQPDVKSVLQDIILSPQERTSDRLAAIKLIGEYFGWKAPTKSQHLTAKVSMDRFGLPGSKKGGAPDE